MRKFTYLALLAAMLCLPQMVLADTDEVVNLTGKTGEVIHNQWTEMVYEYEPYIYSGSVNVQIEKEYLGEIAGFPSYRIEFLCIQEGTAVIKAQNANFDEYGNFLGTYTNYTFNVTVSADPYVSPTYISDADPWAGMDYDWDYVPNPAALHNIDVDEGVATNNWIKLMMIASSNYVDYEEPKFRRQWSDIPTENISIVSDNTSAVIVSGDQFIAQNGAGGQSAKITISCAPDAVNDWVPSASFEFTINVLASTPSTPTGPSFIWNQRQVNLVSLSTDNTYKEQSNALINNIFASLTQTRDRTEDWSDPGYESCQFMDGQLSISNSCGNLTFQSITGDLTGMIITCSDVFSASDLPSGWTYNALAGTLTWVGSAAEEVTLTGNLSCNISSIEFFYSPAATPRLGESFYDDWQWYEITGAHTAKVTAPRNMSGGINIPAYVDDDVRYYITEIEHHAFYDYPQLSNANIGENVAVIGAHAFDGCSWMTEITVDSRVLESIGEAAFKNCLLLQDIEFYTDFPPVLGNDAFYGDTRLNHIHVHSPYVSAYQGTSGWSTYASVIGALWSNPAIGEEFFYHNQKTTGIYEVTSVRTGVTAREAKVLPYSAEINAIYPITYESTLVIPESPDYIHYGYSVTGIAANAFKDITDFKVVMIPQTVKSIESGAFLGCTNVENVFFLWDDPTTVTWADGDDGLEFATAASGTTKIFVPEGTLAAYQAQFPAWASCMIEGEILDVDVSGGKDPFDVVYYRTFFDSEHDYMLPPDVWAYVGYVSGSEFILRPIAFDGEILPKNTAVVLRSFASEYRLIAVDGSSSPMPIRRAAYTGQNDLEGTDSQITRASLGDDADKVYVLDKGAMIGGSRQEGMGMYKYTGTYLGAHKAYMIYTAPAGPSPAPRFLFRPEKDTPMNVENVQENAQCAAKILRNGLLIIIKDGKEYNAQGQIVK